MLSPGTGQVAHALLTRPPLKQESLGFILFPFDLHVLGTPPAFILSQDQTLMLYDRSACSSSEETHAGLFRVHPASSYLAYCLLGHSVSLSGPLLFVL